MSTNAMERPQKISQATGRYLYAIIANPTQPEFGPYGIDGGMVYTIGKTRVAAVVSDIPNERLRPERRRLASHHEVLKRLLQTETILPMAFGVVADGSDAVQRILDKNEEAFGEQLDRFAGKVEMGLRVCWDVPNIFEYFVDTHADLKLLRDSLFRTSREPTQDEKIELGRTFDRALLQDREHHIAQVLSVLGPQCFEVKENKPRDEREVMNLACLIERGQQKSFEEGVFAAAKFFDHHFAFDFNGPWPPHNFVDVTLQT
jgi:hypothetical protein